jgi:hypothetical protein
LIDPADRRDVPLRHSGDFDYRGLHPAVAFLGRDRNRQGNGNAAWSISSWLVNYFHAFVRNNGLLVGQFLILVRSRFARTLLFGCTLGFALLFASVVLIGMNGEVASRAARACVIVGVMGFCTPIFFSYKTL